MRAGAARWPDHGRVRTLCEKFASGNEKTTLPRATQSNPGQPSWPRPSPDLTRGAQSFVDLYDLRQRADYDLASRITPRDARLAIELARGGMRDFDQALLKLTPPDPWASWFFLLLMCEPKQRG
jgi:hypothetical protein